MNAKYRGFEIKYLGGGFKLFEGGFLKETHSCQDDAAIKRYKSMQRIDAIHRHRRQEDDKSIERVDAQVKATRDMGV
jgi:hypothetical protein